MTTQQDMGECSKCDGKGRISAFSHIENGACFTCKGTGKVRIRARKIAPIMVNRIPAHDRMARIISKIELAVANSNNGILQGYCDYSRSLVEAAKSTLAELGEKERGAAIISCRTALGKNAHMIDSKA